MKVPVDTLSSFLSVNCACDKALVWLSQSLSGKGMRILRTFDLHEARLGLENCACPYHGINPCNCQMVVLLVFVNHEEPVTLILHGCDNQTWLSIVNNPLQRAAPSIQLSIEQALQTNPLD